MQNIGNKVWNFIEIITKASLKLIFQVLNKELTDTTQDAFLQFIKFGIVGVSNTLISYVLYVLSLLMFQKLNVFQQMDYLIAQVIAFVLSVLWSFYWNNKMVFQQKENKKRSLWKTLLKTYMAYSFTGLFLNSILLILWVDMLHISEFIAPMLNLLISVPLNFFINKLWAFR